MTAESKVKPKVRCFVELIDKDGKVVKRVEAEVKTVQGEEVKE